MPLDVAGIQTVLTWIAAGFIASEVKNFVVPSPRRSEIHRIVEAVIYTAVLVWLLNRVPPSVRDFIGFDLTDGVSPTSGSTLVVFFLLAAVEGYLWGRMVLSRPYGWLLDVLGVPNRPTATVWNHVLSFRAEREGRRRSERVRWVTVHLDDGTRYLGWPSVFSTDPDGEKYEVCLDEAWLVGPDGERQHEFERVYIPGRAIRAIEIYAPRDSRS